MVDYVKQSNLNLMGDRFERKSACNCCQLLAEIHEPSRYQLDPFDVGVEKDVDVSGFVFDDACNKFFEG